MHKDRRSLIAGYEAFLSVGAFASVVTSAAVTGIIGNAAYEAFKSLAKRRIGSGKQMSREDAALVAGIALVVRCATVDLRPPNLDALECNAERVPDGSWTVVFIGAGATAIVRVPADDATIPRCAVRVVHHPDVRCFQDIGKSADVPLDHLVEDTRTGGVEPANHI